MNCSNKHGLRVWILSVLLVIPIGVINATTISTFGTWNGTSSFGPSFGESGPNNPSAVATYGQTFTVPNSDNSLTSFSIWMRDNTPFNADPLVFDGYVMQWTGDRASGPVLYDSGQITLGTGHSWHEVSFSPLNLTLISGQQYVFIVSASQDFNGLESTADLAGMALNTYTDGMMVNLDNGTDISKWTTEAWQPNPVSWDTVFQAQFASVPDPPRASVFALGLAFLALEGIRRRYATRTLRRF